MKILTPILTVYFLVLFPTAHLFFPGNRFIYEFWKILYFVFVLLLALFLKYVSLKQLGFKNIWNAMIIGILLGILPIISVPLFDGFLVISGLSQSEIFLGANLRAPEEMMFGISFSENMITAIFVTFIDQVFVIGLIVNNLLNKQTAGQAIVGGGLLYTLTHFKPSLGNLILGFMSTGLLRATGSIIAPILVHTGFAIAKILIVFLYPRLISILVFLI